jgi:dTDP-4-amino-4,6-dideoxygalactose transaminase
MMNSAIVTAVAKSKPLLRPFVRPILARFPTSPARLTGTLAKDGGIPVRNVRFRPWASGIERNPWRWRAEARARFREIYLGGNEGLPQSLAIRFAQRWAAYCGCQYGLLLPHGTDALRFGLASALDHDGLDYGGEVIVPNFSFIASATAPLDRRFGVVFVDVDPATLLIDPALVEAAIIPGKTRAILPVHLFGQPADMTSLRRIADKHGLKLIEDAAQAHGAMWGTARVGALGDVGAFSFQSSKNLACGEGGALVTNDQKIFERAYSMHNAGRSLDGASRWKHVSLGWNCRPTEYQAALLLQRLCRFDQEQQIRARNFEYLHALMREIKSLVPLAVDSNVRVHGIYMFAMRYKAALSGNLSLDQFISYLHAEGAPIYRGFDATISQQPAIQDLMKKRPQYFRCCPTPVSDMASQDTVYIPQNVFLGTRRDMEDIIAAVAKVERHFASSSKRH